MEVANFVKSTIGIIVVLIVIVSVAVPILSQMEAGISERANNTTQSYVMMDDAETTVTVDYVSTSSYKINDKTFTLTASSQTLVVLADSLWVQMLSSGSVVNDFQTGADIYLSPGDSLTFADGSWSLTGSTTRSGSYTTLLYPSDRGDLGLFTTPVWIDDDATAYMYTNFAIADSSDDKTRKIYALVSVTGSTSTVVSASIYTTGSGYNQTLDGSLTAVLKETGESSRVSTQYNGVAWTYTPTTGSAVTSNSGVIIAPLSYTTLVGSETPVGAMISIIPMLMIVGLIVAVIALFLRRSEV